MMPEIPPVGQLPGDVEIFFMAGSRSPLSSTTLIYLPQLFTSIKTSMLGMGIFLGRPLGKTYMVSLQGFNGHEK
jgi:hypothetical protein